MNPGVVAPAGGVRDARAVAHFVLYPQPFGLQLESNIGTGPELVDAATVVDAEGEETFTGQVARRSLHGGYALASLKLDTFMPFARVMNYEGGKKHERNAPSYSVRELEAGVEWQIIKPLEVTAAYTVARRTDGRAPYGIESGNLLRLQVQVNY